MVIRRYPDGVIHEFDRSTRCVTSIRCSSKTSTPRYSTTSSRLWAAQSRRSRDFYPLKQGITNLSCHFAVGDDEYVYRHPGIGTEKIVDRSAEFAGLRLAAELGIDDTFITGDPAAGWSSRVSCATCATWT